MLIALLVPLGLATLFFAAIFARAAVMRRWGVLSSETRPSRRSRFSSRSFADWSRYSSCRWAATE